KPAAAAGRVVRARCVDPLRPRLEDLSGECLGVTALHLGHARAHRVARQPTPHEHDEPVQPGDAVAAVRERVDRELELLVPRDRCGHGRHTSSVDADAAARRWIDAWTRSWRALDAELL